MKTIFSRVRLEPKLLKQTVEPDTLEHDFILMYSLFSLTA